jgi:tryptophan-rich sensory protein
MREVPYRDGPTKGEDPHVRLLRQSRMNNNSSTGVVLDPLKLHCWYLQLLQHYDVIFIDKSDLRTGSIDTVIMTQPDFSTISLTQSTDEASHFFLIEYVIQ